VPYLLKEGPRRFGGSLLLGLATRRLGRDNEPRKRDGEVSQFQSRIVF